MEPKEDNNKLNNQQIDNEKLDDFIEDIKADQIPEK